MNQNYPTENNKQTDSEKFFTTPLIIIFVTVFIDLIGFGMVIPILPYYANTPPFNATPLEIGFLVGDLLIDAVFLLAGARTFVR